VSTPCSDSVSADGSVKSSGCTQIGVSAGAFGYSGAAIARRLLAAGREWHAHRHTGRAPATLRLPCTRWISPIRPRSPNRCTASTRSTTPTGCDSRTGGSITPRAIANSTVLFESGSGGESTAGSARIDYPSQPGFAVPLFRGKAEVERALAETVDSYAIAAAAILFGGNGVLLNNIAWLLRRLPIFAIGGGGEYRSTIHVDDLAQLCISPAGRQTMW